MSASPKAAGKKVTEPSVVRADKMAPAVSGFTSSGVGKKVALSAAIERAKRPHSPR